MTPDEQWEQINYARSFLVAVLDRVKALWAAMDAEEADAKIVYTNINDVPITVCDSELGENYVTILIGEDAEKAPLVALRDIPRSWVVNV